MVTYQDLEKLNEDEVMTFVRETIGKHKASKEYREADIAEQYNKKRNKTIIDYQKLLYTVTGEAVPDNWSANFKLCSNFFNRFVTQENQYLLGNGVQWEEETTSDKLGKDFDTQLQDAGEKALVHGVSFGFWNMDHLEVFSFLEFAPLFDEETGALKAGIRFWQIDASKPLRATLYELDGYTDYIWRPGEDGQVLNEKRSYNLTIKGTDIDGMEIVDGENYKTFPIVPLYGNKQKQSEFVGMRENIDCYDLIKSGFANDLDDASQIYWILQGAGGMDDIDLAKFTERIKTTRAAVVEGGVHAESHTQEVPYASREAMLARLRSDLFEDAQALDVREIAAGATTATQIRAAYEPLNSKCDKYEYCIIEFINNILDLVGIEDKPTFTRSAIVNTNEEVGMILQAAQYLEPTYVTEKILNLLGDGDRAEEMIKQMLANQVQALEPQEEEGEV